MLFLPSCRVDAVHSDGSDVAPKGGYKVEDHHKPGSVGAEVGHMHACSEQLRLSGVVAAPMFSNIDQRVQYCLASHQARLVEQPSMPTPDAEQPRRWRRFGIDAALCCHGSAGSPGSIRFWAQEQHSEHQRPA